jgi:glycerophosphoryl diester phosphodiesterase
MPSSRLDFTPPFIAHRGTRTRAPENTMPAFLAAHEAGAAWIETDVKLTADGVAILFHDDTLDRTTDGHGDVADAPWADIQKLDAGTWFDSGFRGTRVPLLADLLAFARVTGMRLNLEIKPCPGRAQATAMVTLMEVAKAWPVSMPPPLISSFDIDALMAAAQLHPDWPRGLLLDEWRPDWRELVERTGARTINVNADILTRDRIEDLCGSGLQLLCYTVNDPVVAGELLRAGVSALFCDDPAKMMEDVR